jgi:hypothetical protein
VREYPESEAAEFDYRIDFISLIEIS